MKDETLLLAVYKVNTSERHVSNTIARQEGHFFSIFCLVLAEVRPSRRLFPSCILIFSGACTDL